MSSPVRWIYNQSAGTTTPPHAELDRIRALRGTSRAIQRAATLQPANDPGTESEDLVARALAVLQREQERWRATRSEITFPGRRS